MSTVGGPDGMTWATALRDLNAALSAAQYGDQVWVAACTYKQPANVDRNSSFILKNGIKMYGGFKGNETILAQRDWRNQKTILSGEIGLPSRKDNLYHVVYGKGLDSTTVLDGVSVMGGYCLDISVPELTTPESCGAGIMLLGDKDILNSKPKLVNCRIFQNTANYGAGICISSTDLSGINLLKYDINPIIENCVIEQNYAEIDGGGIWKLGSMPLHDTFLLPNTRISDNRARQGKGGGICFKEPGNTILRVENCYIGRDSALDGGDIFFTGARGKNNIHVTFIILKTQFIRNHANSISAFSYSDYSYEDNGLLPKNTTVETLLDGCLVKGNFAANGAALAFGKYDGSKHQFTMKNTEFRLHSTTPGLALGFFNTENDINIETCLFTGTLRPIGLYFNAGCHGETNINNCVFKHRGRGAIEVRAAERVRLNTNINNCTFYNNNSPVLDNLCYNSYNNTDTIFHNMHINNSIFEEKSAIWNEIFANGGNDYSTLQYVFNNCIINMKDFKPWFIPLKARNVLYDVDPEFVDPAINDFHLQSCSPAIGKGRNQYALDAGLTEDFDGNPRILFKNVDLGAYEQADSCGISRTDDILFRNPLFTIWPNPSENGHIQWQCHQPGLYPVQISVVKTEGKVMNTTVSALQQSEGTINAASLPEGVYILRFTSKEATWSQKWVR